MVVLGVDPSSSATGIALFVDDKPIHVATWKPSSRLKTFGEKLLSYDGWLEGQLMTMPAQPDKAVVEFCTNVAWASMHAIRVLAHYESASYMVLHRAGVPLRYDVTATMARAHVFGGHVKKKEQAVPLLRAAFPEREFTEHEADAAVLALAHDCAPAPPKKKRRR